jgi:hypothetical protein
MGVKTPDTSSPMVGWTARAPAMSVAGTVLVVAVQGDSE